MQVQDLSKELSESFDLKTTDGTLVAGVIANGPAFKAGIRRGDILTAINSQQIKDSNNMLNLIANLRPNEQVLAKLLRNGKEITVSIIVGTRPAPAN